MQLLKTYKIDVGSIINNRIALFRIAMYFKVLFVVATVCVAAYSQEIGEQEPVNECHSCISKIPGDECHAGGRGIEMKSCGVGTIRCVTITGGINGTMGMVRACSPYEDCSTFSGFSVCIVCNWDGCNEHRL
ncbi:hypothetical protein PPYR_09747 [Photinus pyralis]|uniref:Protein sleepless n=1 Tax=Photinus pyralis TaxID=7054 RepID=A0A5N4AEE0_PHOPY|nr:uncharacterized protein LOC116174369 [Photinus pyralis]KAB0795686.1 hypothetical protein PPYR_09747 [Photinus pyralis]